MTNNHFEIKVAVNDVRFCGRSYWVSSDSSVSGENDPWCTGERTIEELARDIYIHCFRNLPMEEKPNFSLNNYYAFYLERNVIEVPFMKKDYRPFTDPELNYLTEQIELLCKNPQKYLNHNIVDCI
ncbi:MAG: hypothetical protein PHF86_05590 [Candidatus Nanoarchaeia archaeon]|nr:hypothetical protein [Candidatus Nanoarchaeia archaeon]